MHQGRKYKVLWLAVGLFLLVFQLSNSVPGALSSLTVSRTVGSLGSIDYPSPPPPPQTGYLAYTSFEGTTTPNNMWESTENIWTAWATDGYASKQIVTSFVDGGITKYPVEGSRCLYEETDLRVAPAYRGFPQTTDLYVSLWIYFPSSFTLKNGNPYIQFYEVRESGGSAEMALSLYIFQKSPWTQNDFYWWAVYGGLPDEERTSNQFKYFIYSNSWDQNYGRQTSGTVSIQPHEVPIGRWWKLEIYLHRDVSNGIFKVWVTDPDNSDPSRRGATQLLAIEGCRTLTSSSSFNYLTVPKLYPISASPAQGCYWDEVYLYGYNAHNSTQ